MCLEGTFKLLHSPQSESSDLVSYRLLDAIPDGAPFTHTNTICVVYTFLYAYMICVKLMLFGVRVDAAALVARERVRSAVIAFIIGFPPAAADAAKPTK